MSKTVPLFAGAIILNKLSVRTNLKLFPRDMFIVSMLESRSPIFSNTWQNVTTPASNGITEKHTHIQ